MDAKDAYVSSIPPDAREKVTAKLGDGSPKRAEYYIDKDLVGIRMFGKHGIECEYSFRDGKNHGWEYHWYDRSLQAAEYYEDGLSHGIARQWDESGRLIGTYTMDHGTGWDLWYQSWPDGRIELSEARHYLDGYFGGYERWFSGGEESLWQESHYVRGDQHGIERHWNQHGRLCRGYPKYFVHNERVNKAKYVGTCKVDATLPPFRKEDNERARTFPPEVEAAMESRKRR